MKKPTIFICHSNIDKPFVRDLVKKLHADGVETWFDEVEIKIGESIHQKVNDGLKKSDLFVVVLSRSSVKSRWVQEELSSASNIEKYEKRGIFILPLLLEECDVPPLLLDRRYANFKDDSESAYRELIDSIYQYFREMHPDVSLPKAVVPEVDNQLIHALVKEPSLLLEMAPRQFEELVASVLSKMGYETTLTPVTRDGGYDVIAMPHIIPGVPPLKVLIECKRVSRPIGATEIRQLLGTLVLSGAARGMFVTSSYFTRAAKEIAQGQPIDLIDAQTFSEWLKKTAG